MILYLFFLILSFLPLIEGELLGIGRFLLLASCLPLAIYLYRKHINSGYLYVIFGTFLFFTVLSTIFSPVFSRSLNTLILYFVYFIYFLTAKVLAKKEKSLFKDLLIVAVIFPSLILCLLSFYLVLRQEPPPFTSMNLIFANFGHNHLVDYLIFSFPLSLILFFKEKKGWKKILFLFLNLIFLSGFILSFSRGGVLMAILIVFLLQVFVRKRKQANTQHVPLVQLSTFFMLLLLVFTLMFSVSGYYFFGEEKLKNFDSLFLKKVFRQPSIESRLEYWQQAVLAFKEKPLLGWGLDNFRYLSKKYQKSPSVWSWYTHNHFLQMFVETGIFGGLSFLFLIFLLLKKALSLISKRLSLNDLKYPLTIGLSISIIHSLFDYDWQFPSVFLIFWTIAGYLNKSKTKNQKLKTQIKNSKINKTINTIVLFLGIMLFIIAVFEFTGNLFLFSAAKAEEEQNYQKAENYYQKSLIIWPFKLEKWQGAIHYYENQDQKEEALKLLNKLIILEPINDKNFRLMGDIYYKDREIDQVSKYYQKTIKLNPMSEDIYFKLIDIWPKKQEKNPQELFQILTQLEKFKGEKCLLKCLGFDNEEKILNLLLQLIESEDFNQLNKNQQAKVYYWLAILSTYQKDLHQDIEFLQKAINLDEKKEYKEFLNDVNLVKEMQTQFWNGDFQTVKKLAKTFESKDKNHIFHQKFYLDEVYLLLEKISKQEGNSKQSQLYHQKALEINPWLEE